MGLVRNRPGSRYDAPSPEFERASRKMSIGLPDLREHEDRQDDRGRHQQHGLDDLHPGRGDHAAEDHVGEHEDPRQQDRELETDAHEGVDQQARAHHLGDQVEAGHREGAQRRGRTSGLLVHAEREHVGDRVLARVAHPLGEEEQHRQERDQEADRVQEPVESEQEDQAGDAQERRRRHVVAGDGETVLCAADAASRGPEVGGRCRAPRGPVGDAKGDPEDHPEDRQGFDIDVCRDDGHRLTPSPVVPVPSPPGAGRPDEPEPDLEAARAFCAAFLPSGSKTLSARRT